MSVRAAELAGDAGMARALRAERVARWREQADQWLDAQPYGTLFTADDLVAAVGLPDSGQGRNNVVGAWVGSQARRGLIEFTGRMGKSRRVEGHGNLQRLWRVKEPPRERVGGDAERLGPDGVSSSPATVGREPAAVSSDPAVAGGLADAPPGGSSDMAPGWLLRSLQGEEAA